MHLAWDRPFLIDSYDVPRVNLGGDFAYSWFRPKTLPTATGVKNPLLNTWAPYVGPTYTIDPGRKPREITMTVRDDSVRVPFLGIYELKGNVLKICFGIPGQRPERPTEMTGSAGTKQVLYVFKRLGTPEQD